MVVGPIFVLLALVGLAAIFIWLVQLFLRLVRLARGWESPRLRDRYGRTALDVLEHRLATGEIDADEFEQKRRLLLASKTR